MFLTLNMDVESKQDAWGKNKVSSSVGMGVSREACHKSLSSDYMRHLGGFQMTSEKAAFFFSFSHFVCVCVHMCNFIFCEWVFCTSVQQVLAWYLHKPGKGTDWIP